MPTIYHYFFFQSEVCIRHRTVTGVQTCALPISRAELLQQTHDVRFIEVVGEQIQTDFGIGQAFMEEAEHHRARMVTEPGILGLDGRCIVVECLSTSWLDGSILELPGIGLRREVATSEAHLKVLELGLRRYKLQGDAGRYSRCKLSGSSGAEIHGGDYISIGPRHDVSRKIHPAELLKGGLIGRSPRALLWRGRSGNGSVEAQAVQQIGGRSIGRSTLYRKASEVCCEMLIEVEGQ